MNNKYNLMYHTDFYKIGHKDQYPTGTTNVYSVWTARNTKYAATEPGKVVHFGIKYYLTKLESFSQWFFNLTMDELYDELDEYKTFLSSKLGTDIDVSHWETLWYHGKLPLRIKSVKEGEQYDIQTPLVTIENTEPEFFWLTNFIETSMSATLWQGSVSATIAREIRVVLEKAYKGMTDEEKSFIDYQAHDFSYRGMSSDESAIVSGMAHLTQFTGSDTIPAIKMYNEMYDNNKGVSVIATEHSVMCAYGKDNEPETYRTLLENNPTGLFSIVSDTWDYFNVLDVILPSMKDVIESRDGKLVIRPDSGNPEEIIIKSLHKFKEHFSYRLDSTGRIVFNKVGLIYGDGMTIEVIKSIIARMKSEGFSVLNIVFGVGSYTYQYNTRDTYSFAMKATSVVIDDEVRDIIKDPKTDPGKKSLTGRFDDNADLEVVYEA
jgi:nicotinamide phosphoribosyltransferase